VEIIYGAILLFILCIAGTIVYDKAKENRIASASARKAATSPSRYAVKPESLDDVLKRLQAMQKKIEAEQGPSVKTKPLTKEDLEAFMKKKGFGTRKITK